MGNAGGFSKNFGVPPCHALHGPMGLTLLQGKNYCLESWNTVFLAVAVCRRVTPYTAPWALLSYKAKTTAWRLRTPFFLPLRRAAVPRPTRPYGPYLHSFTAR